jgi:hypothetical protein
MMKQRIRVAMLGLAALWFVSAANAQVTITSVKVTVGNANKTAVYCDTVLVASCGANAVSVWDLAGGVSLTPGQTLVLTQTGFIPNTILGNFDTSDRATLPLNVNDPGTRPCGLVSVGVTEVCTVTITINGTQVYSNSTGDPLDFFNADFVDNGSTGTNEGHQWVLPPAVDQTAYTISLGYADNEHSCSGAATCFPSPFTDATHFIGGGVKDICTSSPNCYDGGAMLITAKTVPVTAIGRMTGGGSVFTADGTRVTHGFEIHCDVTDVPNTLEINWAPANNFHMDVLDTAVCTQTPAIQAPPDAPFDTFKGTGTGKLNGVPGATIEFTFVDGGEPGTKDTAAYLIKDSHGTVLSVGTTFLTKGNQQAHN